MTRNENDVQFIITLESYEPKAYPDGSSYSIGYGHHTNVTADMTCTRAQATQWLNEDCQVCEDAINNLVKVPLNRNQFRALLSFCYNCGTSEKGFAGSTLLKKLNKGDYAGAANEFSKWINSGGKKLQVLVDRRKKEKNLFLTPVERIQIEPIKDSNMKTHWQTTILGILTILATLSHAGISYLNGQHVDTTVLFAGITTGVGLLRAADSSKVQEK